jgi:uncharacterized protein YjaG (DUF416 family)
LNSLKTDILILEMAEISIAAHTKYVLPRIQNKQNRKIYQDTINSIFTVLQQSQSALEFVSFLETFKNSVPNDSWYNLFSSPKHYKMLAVEHVEDVIHTLETRFNKSWALPDVYNA